MVARRRYLVAVVVTGASLWGCGDPGSDATAPGISPAGLTAPPTPGTAVTVPRPSGDTVATTDADVADGGDAGPLDAIRLPDDDGTFPPDTPVTCNGTQFEFGDLDALAPAEAVEPSLRSVLAEWLAGPEGQYWPQDGWVLLSADDERATFTQISDDGVSFVGAVMGADGWIWAGASGSGTCDVRLVLPDGVGDADWVLDPSGPPPGPTTTEIVVLVTERACASGQEMGDRLLGPQVVETSDVVLIAFGVVPRPGDQTCPSNPSTPVVVALDAPLGAREIRDGLAIGPLTSLLPDSS